jgi:hypothetical protein
LASAKTVRDAHVRSALRERLDRELTSGTIIVPELLLGNGGACIDLAVIGSEIHGYEIKAEADRLTRLPSQTAVYNETLDKVTLVVDVRHLGQAWRLIPMWWGLMVVFRRDDHLEFRSIRDSKQSPATAPDQFIQIAWRDEMRGILSRHGLSAPKSASRADLRKRLLANVPFPAIHDEVLNAVVRRTGWREDSPAPR